VALWSISLSFSRLMTGGAEADIGTIKNHSMVDVGAPSTGCELLRDKVYAGHYSICLKIRAGAFTIKVCYGQACHCDFFRWLGLARKFI